MKLVDALRLNPPIQIAFAGAGGKSTAMFRLARQLRGPVFVTTSTHLGMDQVGLADHLTIIKGEKQLEDCLDQYDQGVNLLTGPETPGSRFSGLEPSDLDRLHVFCHENSIPLLVEADGSRGLPLKVPASHEPVIPGWVNAVIYLAGMAGINQPLTSEFVHRIEQFSSISGLEEGDIISAEAVIAVLTHLAGGLKNIPVGARRIVMLNQADTNELQSQAGKIAEKCISKFDYALVSSLRDQEDEIKACYSPIAGIILAAGGSSRFGQSKPLLMWREKPFVRQVTETALHAGLDPVLLIAGFHADQVKSVVKDLPVQVVINSEWMAGQSTSVIAGIRAIEAKAGAALFLLADQPQISQSVITALIERHRQTMAPIIAPLVQGKRANPVLFDRAAFPALASITGDSGGRQVFSRFKVLWLEWNDANLLLDVDTPEDYQKLLEIQ